MKTQKSKQKKVDKNNKRQKKEEENKAKETHKKNKIKRKKKERESEKKKVTLSTHPIFPNGSIYVIEIMLSVRYHFFSKSNCFLRVI